MACSCCSGTDCAAACDQGQCYAEERQRQEEDERGELEAQYEEAAEAAQAIGEFAQSLGSSVPFNRLAMPDPPRWPRGH